jgi:hypothetical protein
MKILFTSKSAQQYKELENNQSQARILKDVRKALAYMESNLRHPSLNTHEYYGLRGAQGEKVFEAYAQNNTPGAYRILWHFGPEKETITIIAIIPHP